MLIYSVELQNFKSYASAKVSFHLGTNAILGQNGAGKSTLLEAIGFALFDHIPTARQGDLLREGAASGSVVVTICSSLDERPYEIERQFGKGGTTRHRVYDCEYGRSVLAESVNEVRAWVHQHLGIDPEADLEDLFRNTIGVPQGSFTAPFLLAPGERKRIFDPLLRVDEYGRAYDNLRETGRYLSDQEGALNQEIARLEGVLAQLPSLAAERLTLSAEIDQLERQAQQLEEALSAARSELRAMDAAQREVTRLELERTQAEAHLQTAHNNRAAAEKSLAEAEEASQRLVSAEPGYRAYLAAEERRATLEQDRARRDEAARELERLRISHSRVETQLEQVQQALQEIEQASRELEALRPRVQEQRALQSQLDTARAEQRAVDEAHRQARDLASEIAKLEGQLVQLDAALARGSTLEARRVQLQEELASVEDQMQALTDRQSSFRAELARLQEQATALQKSEGAQCPTCESELTPERRHQLLERNAAQTGQCSAALNAALLELRALSARRESLRREQGEIDQQLRALPSAQQRDALAEMLGARQASLIELRERLAAAEAIASKVPELARRLEALQDPISHSHVLESRVAEQATRRAENDQLRAQLARIASQSSLWMDRLAQFEQLDDRLAQVTAELARYRRDHDEYLSAKQVAAQREPRRAALAREEQRVAELAARLAKVAEAYAAAAAAYDSDEHERIRQRVERQHAEATQARTRLQAYRERLEIVTREIARLEGEQDRLEGLRGQVARIARQASTLQEIRELLRAAGPYVTRQLVENISAQASAFYCDIMSDYSGRLNWSEDYEATLEVKGRSRSFQQLSGGEQMTAALALRLALLRQLSNVNIAFFDEPTAHLDPERRDGLAEKIMQVKGFDQLFVISHDDTFERAAQHYIRIVKTDGISAVAEP